MSGILAVIGKGKDPQVMKELSARMAHRGSQGSGLHVMEKGHILCHESFVITDLETGKQPVQGTKTAWMIHDGKIYNHQDLKEKYLANHTFRTKLDSEVIVHLYEELGYEFCDLLQGDFAFVIINEDDFIVGRDALGVKPLYYGLDDRSRIYFASEMKAIADQCKTFSTFPPGHYYTPKTGFVKFYNPEYEDFENATQDVNLDLIRETLINAIHKHLMTEMPVGVLLSGGLDSSLISAISARIMKKEGKELKSFSVALNAEAPDAIAAKQVADFIGTEHHEIYFTVEEGIALLDKLIGQLETYDVISVRASVPMFFVSKAIADLGIKVVLSGEGADEIFGGYLYFRNAPSLEEFQKEIIERVQKLFTADLLRADKSTLANGVEVRIPFLDKQFLDVAMLIKPSEKQPQTYDNKEKYILRKAFDLPEDPYLPNEILWRQKEQFSDGVGYTWVDELIEFSEKHISDEQLKNAGVEFPYNPPTTKEAYLYRSIFHKHFPQVSAAETVRKWIPKWQHNLDPSGRSNTAHIRAALSDNKTN